MQKLLEKTFFYCSGHKIFYSLRIYEGIGYCPKCKKELFEYVHKQQEKEEIKRKKKEDKDGTI